MNPLVDQKPLEIRLFHDDDDDEDLVYKNLLHSLINQSQSPSSVATKIDEWVTRKANERYNALKSRSPPFQLTPDEEEWPVMRRLGPNPAKDINALFEAIAAICSAFSPDSTAQNLLIECIQALARLPRHSVPCVSSKEDDSGGYDFTETKTLWQFGTDEVRYLMMNFHSEAEALAYPFSDIETPGSDVQLRWRNLQAFIARLTSSDLIDCGDLCALENILPSSSVYPDLDERKIGGPKRIEGDLLAGSYWLSNGVARQWVYQRCKDSASQKRRFYDLWSMETWEVLKAQLAFISSDERFTEAARTMAASLRDGMISEEAK